MTPQERQQREARVDALRTLEPCHGVVQHPRYDLPFRITVPLTPLPPMSHAEVAEMMRPFWVAHPPVPVLPDSRPESRGPSDDAKRFLMQVANHPDGYSSEHYGALGLSLATGTRLRASLEEGGYIKIHRISTGRRGREPEIIEVLETGYGAIGLKVPPKKGKGGQAHRFWCLRISRSLKALGHCEVTLEKFLNGDVGKAADVGVKAEDGVVAYECQLDARTDLVRDLIIRDLRAGFIKVVLCVLTQKDISRAAAVIAELDATLVQHELKSPVAGRVEMRLLSAFLKKGGTDK